MQVKTYHTVIERDESGEWFDGFGSYSLAEVKKEVAYLKEDKSWAKVAYLSYPDIPGMLPLVLAQYNKAMGVKG